MIGKGKIPCDVLFLGEAPGAGENTLGQPFVGPAGHLLDQIVGKALGGKVLRMAYANVIGCIPIDEEGDKVGGEDIPDREYKRCHQRVEEFVYLVKPKLIVLVGKNAAKWGRVGPAIWKPRKYVEVRHPAFLLRAPEVSRGLECQSVEITLAEVFSELFS